MALCVLTGDIVGSTRLTVAQQRHIERALGEAYSDLDQNKRSTFDTYRGDGWQMSFADGHGGLRSALYVRALLKYKDSGFETRIALAERPTPVGPIDIKSAVFVNSGRALDGMSKDAYFAHSSGGEIQAATILADHISRGWTQSQARAVRYSLLPDSGIPQQKIADHFGISRQAVGQALEAAGYPAIKAALAAIEAQAK